jgi:hypothetical protein
MVAQKIFCKAVICDNETEIFLGILMKYQLQGRYPDYNTVLPDILKVNEYFEKTKTLLKWLKEKL